MLTVSQHLRSLTIRDNRPSTGPILSWLSVGEYGFKLSRWERMNTYGQLSDFTPERMLVNCRSADEKPIDGDDGDLEALEIRTEGIEGFISMRTSDEDWQWQVNLARESHSSLVPNGIDYWLESIPIDNEEDAPVTVRIQWGV